MNRTILSALRYSAFALVLSGAAVACCVVSDKDYDDVTPPVIEVAPSTLSGLVTAKSGAALSGATVQAGTLSAQTDANGYYEIPDMAPGLYPVTITAPGKLPHEGEVEIPVSAQSVNVQYNAALASEESQASVVVTAAEGGEGDTTTEALDQNDPAEIDIEVEIPAGTTDDDVTFYLTPIYDESEAVSKENATPGTKAPDSDARMLIGVTLSCSDPDVVINKPIPVRFNVDAAFTPHVSAKHYIGNDEWEDMESSAEEGVITIMITALGSYGVFLPFVLSERSGSEKLNFVNDVWDNLYGSAPMTVQEAPYTYGVGTSIDVAGQSKDVMSALLLEKLAYYYGTDFRRVDAAYPLNVTLPIGTRLTISGTQQIVSATVSYGSWSVSGTHYGDVLITTASTNRQHNGGSN